MKNHYEPLEDPFIFFISRMRLKLSNNSHKGHWRNDNLMALRQRLLEELLELDEALGAVNPIAINIADECADIANFAMMIADNVRNGATILQELKNDHSKPNPGN